MYWNINIEIRWQKPHLVMKFFKLKSSTFVLKEGLASQIEGAVERFLLDTSEKGRITESYEASRGTYHGNMGEKGSIGLLLLW